MIIEVVHDFVNRFVSQDAVHKIEMPEAYHSIDACAS